MNSTGFIPDSRRAFADASCRLKLISLLFKVNSRLDKVIEWPPGLTLSLKKVYALSVTLIGAVVVSVCPYYMVTLGSTYGLGARYGLVQEY